ncbi:ogr/Delta-like zinc finger family protein [Chromobacterium subtsugae]|uniref:ogr/Delta-like zinc finger family protein n=1 Tax=Chromobacterium subtsugae TaxID=251747 RepID=UPI000640F3E0
MTAMRCPACGESALTIRTSREQTPATREIYAICKVCGTQPRGVMEWLDWMVEGLLPASMHRAKLPQSPAARRQEAMNHYRQRARREPDNQISLF